MKNIKIEQEKLIDMLEAEQVANAHNIYNTLLIESDKTQKLTCRILGLELSDKLSYDEKHKIILQESRKQKREAVRRSKQSRERNLKLQKDVELCKQRIKEIDQRMEERDKEMEERDKEMEKCIKKKEEEEKETLFGIIVTGIVEVCTKATKAVVNCTKCLWNKCFGTKNKVHV